ncbi:DegT/DnrJ/EryC1/StrS family aminotransferase [Haloglomus litoreum]|uniref:DegT/DnrJ/EryC1/StrS family aminotransferase n=1 Tax=Haloglomus litoreum TaxID=3034026 RepID=UPI0023E838A3|nr:DegT/DnrJ/EryC1/StrS family aminotransferase [Haloglomus sp. DT116]
MSQPATEERIPLAAPDLGTSARRNAGNVLSSGQLAEGPQVAAFESAFADFCGTDHAVATSNGTTALHTALEALGLGAGDTVLTTPFSFVATANAIRFAGATPAFADVDPTTLNLDPTAAERRLREGDVDAMIVVHLYGLPAEMDRFAALAQRYDVALIEDCAQAHGATFDGKHVGAIGDAGCFSFYPTKNMTTGEGGMVVTDRESVAERARRFIDHGRTGRYEHAELGHNFRMTDMAAAIGRAQLDRLPSFVATRRRNADRLDDGLDPTPLALPVPVDGARHAYNQYTVRARRIDRDDLRAALDDAGIDTGIYYPTPIHQQPAYAGHRESYPISERAATEVLSLPVHPGLSDADVDRIVAAVREVTRDA